MKRIFNPSETDSVMFWYGHTPYVIGPRQYLEVENQIVLYVIENQLAPTLVDATEQYNACLAAGHVHLGLPANVDETFLDAVTFDAAYAATATQAELEGYLTANEPAVGTELGEDVEAIRVKVITHLT